MPDHITPVLAAALAVELGLFFAGLVVWWRAALSPSARARPPRLAPWPVSPSDFFACALIVVGGGFFSLLVVHVAGRPFLPKSPAADTNALVYGTALQLGLLAGVAGARVLLQGRFDRSGICNGDRFVIDVRRSAAREYAGAGQLSACRFGPDRWPA